VIDLVRFLDDRDFIAACTALTGEPPPKANGGDRTAEPRKIVAAEFRYENESGEVVFVVERVEYQNADGTYVETKEGKRRKTFRQKRPDPDNPGQWIWNITGVPAVPYRLPELLEGSPPRTRSSLSRGRARSTCCAPGTSRRRAAPAGRKNGTPSMSSTCAAPT
jgi:hypothetical protein